MSKSLAEISETMKDIDFCMVVSRAADGALSGRPMSNNREVAYEGTNWFFSLDDTQLMRDIAYRETLSLQVPTELTQQAGEDPEAKSKLPDDVREKIPAHLLKQLTEQPAKPSNMLLYAIIAGAVLLVLVLVALVVLIMVLINKPS